MRPAVSAIAKAGKGSLGVAGSTITSRETTLQTLRLLVQPWVSSYADHVLDAEKLAEFIKQWQSEPGVSAQFDAGLGKLFLESRDDAQQHRDDASVTCRGAATQSGRQQTTSVTLKDQQRVIHVLVIATVEEAELLLPVRWIVSGIDIQQNLSSFANLFSADLHKPIEQSILQMEEIARCGRVLPATERWL